MQQPIKFSQWAVCTKIITNGHVDLSFKINNRQVFCIHRLVSVSVQQPFDCERLLQRTLVTVEKYLNIYFYSVPTQF